VDDEQEVRRSMERLLRSAGYAVAVFATGGEFLESLATQRPACVLVDGELPDMYGWDVLDGLARLAPGVPAIVVTGHDTPVYRGAAAAHGAAAFFPKPYDPAALLAAIETAIGGNRTSRAPT
jgi:two-component system response regulator FixJ